MSEVRPLPNHSWHPDSFEWVACEGGPAAVWREVASRTREHGDRCVTRTPKAERLIIKAAREPDHVKAAVVSGVPGVASSLRSSGQPEWLASAVLAENFAHMPLLAAILRVCRIAEPGELAEVARMSHLAIRELMNWQERGFETDERWELSRGKWRPITVLESPRDLLLRHARFTRSELAPKSRRGRPAERPRWTNRVDLIYRETVDALMPNFCMAVPSVKAVLTLCIAARREAAEPLRSEAQSLLHDAQSESWAADPSYRLKRWAQCSAELHRLFVDLRFALRDETDFSPDEWVHAVLCELAASRVPANRMPADRRWAVVSDIAQLHARLSGRPAPEIVVTGNRPSGPTHEFIILIGRIYKLHLVSDDSADYVRRIGAN